MDKLRAMWAATSTPFQNNSLGFGFSTCDLSGLNCMLEDGRVRRVSVGRGVCGGLGKRKKASFGVGNNARQDNGASSSWGQGLGIRWASGSESALHSLSSP